MKKELVLVLNCGSSSIKFAILNTTSEQMLISGLAERIGSAEGNISWKYNGEKHTLDIADADHAAATAAIVDIIGELGDINTQLAAVGHRVVHGGEKFTNSVIVNEQILADIDACAHLAPLHNPANILGIKAAQHAFPELPHIAVFDTAFHQTMPKTAYLYPIPYTLYQEHAVRRYGFHGTSHRYVSAKAAEQLGKPLSECAFVCAHLGNGCSATAILNGKSVDTTMGLTPLEGLVMGTRSGDIDPSIHQYLTDTLGWDIAKITSILNKESGLKGLSGLSNDMRTLTEAAAQGNEQAQLAIDIFCYRLAKYIAAYTVPLGRLDAVLFTGGIGENAAGIRKQVLQLLTIFGFSVNDADNSNHGANNNGIITDNSGPVAMVINTNEELLIAQDSIALIGQL